MQIEAIFNFFISWSNFLKRLIRFGGVGGCLFQNYRFRSGGQGFEVDESFPNFFVGFGHRPPEFMPGWDLVFTDRFYPNQQSRRLLEVFPKLGHLFIDLTLQNVLQLLLVHFVFLLVVAASYIDASIASAYL